MFGSLHLDEKIYTLTSKLYSYSQLISIIVLKPESMTNRFDLANLILQFRNVDYSLTITIFYFCMRV